MTGLDKFNQILIRPKVMGETAVISIIMPVKNIVAWIQNIKKNLEFCADSGFLVEFIFVYTEQEGDRSITLLKGLSDEFSCEEVVIRFAECRQPGIYIAMNRGVDVASSRMLLFLGADDTLAPGLVEALPYIIGSNSPCILADTVILGQSGGEISDLRKSGGRAGQIHWLLGMPRIHQSIIYNASYIKVMNMRFNPNLKVTSDYILTCEVIESMDSEPFVIDRVIASYNDSGFSSRYSSWQLYLEHIKGFAQSSRLRKYLPLVVLTRFMLISFKLARFVVGV